ncbi:hypothetical protein AB0L49_49955 [Streptomyces antimycoticus]|uniref:hypothetical protein n=1 Tax=Streptomyces antimycoticus TaxID=68175 RepID=UPI00342CA85A
MRLPVDTGRLQLLEESEGALRERADPAYLRTAFPQQAKALDAMADIGTRTSPNMEKPAAAKPDLILVNSAQGNLYATLSAIAPTLVTKGRGVNWKKDPLTVADAVASATGPAPSSPASRRTPPTRAGNGAASTRRCRWCASTPTGSGCSGRRRSPAPSPTTWGSAAPSPSASTTLTGPQR